MSKLQTQYSKDIARELGKIAVYLPGEEVAVGDIITFPYGKTGLFNRDAPLGSFKKITTLKRLGIAHADPGFSNHPDTYHYTSRKSVAIRYGLESGAETGNAALPGGTGTINIEFSSEGAIYFLAVDCDKKEFQDITFLEKEINTRGKELPWESTYLVTSVTVARKALIAISRSSASELEIAGDVKGLQSGPATVKAQTGLHIKKQKGKLFTKDWSDNVTVFMDLMKFEKEVFGVETYKGTKAPVAGATEKLRLKKVDVKTLLQ